MEDKHKYRYRPLTLDIQAIQFDGTNIEDVKDFLCSHLKDRYFKWGKGIGRGIIDRDPSTIYVEIRKNKNYDPKGNCRIIWLCKNDYIIYDKQKLLGQSEIPVMKADDFINFLLYAICNMKYYEIRT